MRNLILLIPFFMVGIFLSGCIDPGVANGVRIENKKNEAAGSPYRLRAYRVPGGTAVEKYRVIPPSPIAVPTDLQPTTANAELRTEVLNKIAALQQDWGNSNAPDLLGVKPEGVVQNSIKESWFIKWDDNAIRYEVTMTPSPQGGTDFKLVGP